ncbi:hypothetical protein ACQYZY_26775 [Pseudomonas aeruginosa]|jgi:hypothetical protein|uniref:hypothetical protein n=1 Tax=Pseudomonas aeruginosa TaxID=287 RepID=UPI001A2A46EE|nr:hypothetical protein [Pseudomonas aeruginosa]EKV0397257.1 hypothetical protein [Pseudomonas aeruginosa]EKV3012176.1 hypothetical protein [Pseudomonas aeruginosa]MBH4318845.1 hypothetical protein [Pseudomonas aeruginosa]MBH8701064.1 hypothetical protein [Pseudomonas aeruginosa]WBM10836.1 hypothetical protein M1V28_31005 [Pseudomonas aeruginosa]
MPKKTVLYPYHPVSGHPLVATVDFIPGQVPRTVVKVDGEIQLDEASETDVDWNAAQEQNLNGDLFLADEAGNVCLQSEAVWKTEELCRISPQLGATATSIDTPNHLRQTLQELSSAAREVFLDLDSGQDPMASALQLKALLEANGLWEDFTD